MLRVLPYVILAWAAAATAAPATYRVDPNHTHPLFEVDHFGLSLWRGLFKTTSGTITLDRERGTGSVDVVFDVSSIDLGHDKLNELVVGQKIGDWNGLDVAHFPKAEYKGTLADFVQEAPTRVDGD